MEEKEKNVEAKDEALEKESESPEASESKTDVKEEVNEDVKEKKDSKKEKKDKYKEQIAKLEEENKNLHNEYLKVFAEMENTKRRINEQAIKDRKYASQHVIGELVNPIDMLLQIVNMPTENPEVKNYQIGFQMIANQLVDILKNEGLAPIEIKEHAEYDPKTMEALQTEEVDGDLDNKVLKVMRPGYMYKDRVLRVASVVVGKKKQETKEENKEEEVM